MSVSPSRIKTPSFDDVDANSQINTTQLRMKKFGDSQFSVLCRIRPILEEQQCSNVQINNDQKSVIISGVQNGGRDCARMFTFHHIYSDEVKQLEFTAEICDQVIDNYQNHEKGSLILSYGVTNSGKTHTILGTEQELGVLPELISRLEKKYPNAPITITAIQAYNDDFYSLKAKTRLQPKQTWGSYQFEDYSPELITKQNTKQLLRHYINNRNQNDTKINKKSSRSHAIFKVQCQGFTIGIVDLAGSQRLNKASSNIDQTTSINKSLLSLGRCIQAFKEGGIIPFRESRLTKALMEYFGINFKVYMIAHLNRSIGMLHENLKVLEYAALTKKQLKPLNMTLNQCIAKSAKKNYDKLKAEKDYQIKSAIDASDNASILKNRLNFALTANSRDYKDKTSKSLKKIRPYDLLNKSFTQAQDYDDYDQHLRTQCLNEASTNYRKKLYFSQYLTKMIGRQQVYKENLDKQFIEEANRDQLLLRELQNKVYTSPILKHCSTQDELIEQIKTATKMRIRKEILQQIENEKRGRQVTCETWMGESIKKFIQNAEHKDQIEPIGQEMIVKVVNSQDDQHQELRTPIKSKSQQQESNKSSQKEENLLSRVIKSPMQLLNYSAKKLMQASRSIKDFVSQSKHKTKQSMVRSMRKKVHLNFNSYQIYSGVVDQHNKLDVQIQTSELKQEEEYIFQKDVRNTFNNVLNAVSEDILQQAPEKSLENETKHNAEQVINNVVEQPKATQVELDEKDPHQETLAKSDIQGTEQHRFSPYFRENQETNQQNLQQALEKAISETSSINLYPSLDTISQSSCYAFTQDSSGTQIGNKSRKNGGQMQTRQPMRFVYSPLRTRAARNKIKNRK